MMWVTGCCCRYVHRRFVCKGDASTHAQGTDPRVALGVDIDIDTYI